MWESDSELCRIAAKPGSVVRQNYNDFERFETQLLGAPRQFGLGLVNLDLGFGHSMRLEAHHMDLMAQTARDQSRLATDPYDRWISPEGVCMAEFHRAGDGFLVRFPHQADFLIARSGDDYLVTAWPTLDCDASTLANLYYNQIVPIIGNHDGGLFLHGSAVLLSDTGMESEGAGVAAFLGLSRGGKTTLAGSFAREGYPFLTEDVIDLRREGNRYWLQPKRSKLRLFADSARFLLGADTEIQDDNLKQDVEGGAAFPFAKSEAPLRQIFLLGTDHRAPLSIRRLSSAEALSALLPHSFILDVTDKPRLKAHFGRMADLSQDIACYALDFTRDYGELPCVRAAVLETIAKSSL